jgi:hypothetical protein
MSISIYDKIVVVESPAVKYVDKSTEETLAEAESQLGFKLPASYRAFVLLFGAGRLADSFKIFAPLPKVYKFQGRPVFDLVAEHRRVASTLSEYQLHTQPSDFCLFCVDGGGAMYFWNTLEVVDIASSEYRIYQAIHRDEMYPFPPSFESFVERCCTQGMTIGDRQEPGEEENWSFSRFQVPPRSSSKPVQASRGKQKRKSRGVVAKTSKQKRAPNSRRKKTRVKRRKKK